jgi:hypothetical protein
LETQLHIISTAAIFIAAVVPFYLTVKLRTNNKLRMLTMTLTIFILIHGFYHVAGSMGLELFAEGLLEPFSIIFLILFGIFYLHYNSAKIKSKEVRAW